MPRVSKNSLSPDSLQTIEQYFFSLISSLQKENEIEEFLKDFLTAEEKTMLAKRLVLYLMLQKKYPASTIQQSLIISRETVRIHTASFLTKNQTFYKILDKLIGEETIKQLWEKLETFFRPIDTFVQARTNMRKRAEVGS